MDDDVKSTARWRRGFRCSIFSTARLEAGPRPPAARRSPAVWRALCDVRAALARAAIDIVALNYGHSKKIRHPRRSIRYGVRRR